MGLRHTYYNLKHFYNRLSNRTLGFIVLFVIFLVGYLFYWFLFSYSLIDVTIKSNVDNYKVFLKSEKYGKKYSFDCPEKICVLKQVSPFNYDLKILKNNYEDYSTKFNPKYNSQLEINLHKKVYLKPLESKDNTIELTREEKIELIKLKNKYFWYKKIGNQLFSFKNLGDKLEFSYNSQRIALLDKVNKEEIFFDTIINSDNYYFLRYGDKKYFVNPRFLELTELNLKLDIDYIKKINSNFFLIVTEKGSFLYNIKTKNLSYFNNLFDFVILDEDNYIGIVNDKIASQKKNLGFGKVKGNLLVKYNLKTKKAQLIKKLDLNISKIYKNDLDIILEDDKGNKYELSNF